MNGSSLSAARRLIGKRSGLLAVIGTFVLAVGVAGCDSSGSSSGSSSEQATAGDTNSEPNGDAAVIARTQGIEVTMGDYERFLQRTRLYAPPDGGVPRELPERRKAHPRIQSQTVRSLLEHQVIRREAERRGIEVEETEIRSFLQSDEKLKRFAGGAGDASSGAGRLELPGELTREDLREVARMRLLREKLRGDLLDGLSDEELWETYRRRNDTVRIGYVSVQNTPTPDEIDAFVEETSEQRFEDYLQENTERYRRPKLVELTLVRPEGDAEADESTLQEAADMLGDGKPVDEVASEIGLAAEQSAYLVRKENPEAFGADQKGQTGYQTSGPRGAYAWRVEGWKEGGSPELDRGLRRELAAEMLRDSLVESVDEKLQPVLEAMRQVERGPDGAVSEEALESLEGDIGGDEMSLETASISRADEDNVSGLGLAESVVEAAFELDDESSPVVNEPVLSRGRAVALLELDRTRPDREGFEKQKESFREKVVEEKKTVIVQDFLRGWFSEHEPTVELEKVRDKYGVMTEKPE
jgi:hypothetical protein